MSRWGINDKGTWETILSGRICAPGCPGTPEKTASGMSWTRRSLWRQPESGMGRNAGSRGAG
jgi:hypothetical protein